MSALTVTSVEALAKALTECDELAFANMHADWARESVARSLIASGAVRPLHEAVAELAEDEALHEEVWWVRRNRIRRLKRDGDAYPVPSVLRALAQALEARHAAE